MKRVMLLFLGLSCFAISARATKQTPDYLVAGRDTVPILEYPLETFLGHKNRDMPRLIPVSSTACWRGYYAYWTITDDKLYLLEVRGRNDSRADLGRMFGDGYADGKVFAWWYTGDLFTQHGRRITESPPMGLNYYEFETKRSVKEGVVVATDYYQAYFAGEGVVVQNLFDTEAVMAKLMEIVGSIIRCDQSGVEETTVMVNIHNGKSTVSPLYIHRPVNTYYMEQLEGLFATLKWPVMIARGREQMQRFVLHLIFDGDAGEVRFGKI